MKKFTTLLGASLVSLLVAGCGGGGGGTAAPAEDTPESAAFQYRRGVMQSIAYKVAQARGMAQGEIPVDAAAFTKHASDEVWTNMADFQAKAMDLQNAAQSLATAAQSQGFEAAKGMVQAVGQTCGGCHRPYRRRQE
jgi:cytochrome c556